MKINKNTLRYVVLPGRNPTPQLSDYYNCAYFTWRQVWSDAFRELHSKDRLFSDDFTRQDEIGALFDGNNCVGMSFFRRVDLSRSENREDSYFKVWPSDALSALAHFGNDIIVCSYFTVSSAYRKHSSEIAFKDVILALLTKYFRETGADGMTGTVRNNKGMNECCYRHGATSLLRNVEHHGVQVDLVGFFQASIHECTLAAERELAQVAWDQRIFSNQKSKNILAA